MAIPSVLTEDVLSPQGVQAAGLVAGNLQQIADRQAQLAMAQARLDAEAKMQKRQLDQQSKLADAELKAKSEQYTQYQDFQAKENQKQREFEETREAQRMEVEQKRHDQITSRQDEAIKQANEWKLKELEIRGAKARAASDLSKSFDSELTDITKKREANNKQIAALEFETAVAAGKQKEFVDFVTNEGAMIDAQRTALGSSIADETKLSIESSVTDVLAGQRSGVAGFAVDAATRIPYAPTEAKVAFEAVSRVRDSALSWLGVEYLDPAKANAMTDVALLANSVVEKLGPKLAGVAINGTSADVNAGLSNFMASAVKAQQALASDGAIKGADEEAVMAEFSKHAEKLQDLVGAEALQGIVRGLGAASGTFSGTEETKLTKGEVAARRKAFNDLGRISDVYNIAKNQEGTKLSSSEYDQPMVKVFTDILNGYAKTSFNGADFASELKRIGVKPSQVNGLIEKLKSMKFQPPEELAAKMAELQRQNEELDTITDLASRRVQNEAFGAGAEAELLGVEELRRTLGLD